MYRARRPSDGTAGYHSETISSRAFTPAAQGSGRETSFSYKDVVPTGPGPVGSGRYGVCPGPAGASPASAEGSHAAIITGRPLPRHPDATVVPPVSYRKSTRRLTRGVQVCPTVGNDRRPDGQGGHQNRILAKTGSPDRGAAPRYARDRPSPSLAGRN